MSENNTKTDNQTAFAGRLNAMSPAQLFLSAAGFFLVVRLLTLVVSNADLGPDEAQYWYWSQDPAFGYFSKPPMIAWLIGAATALFGDAEWAVRLAAPLLHTGTAIFIFLTAQRLASDYAALWAGLTWLLLPGVMLSSFLITTDAPLLFFWSAGLYVFVRLMEAEKPSLALYAVLGGLIGLGLLSKYAMIYFLVALAAASVRHDVIRNRMASPGGLVTLAVAAALIAPNIAWNMANDFSTISHTAANANWSENLFHPISGLTFLISQFVVAGIIPLAALILITLKKDSDRKTFSESKPWSLLWLFVLTPLVIVAIQAFLSRAHANWAAAAYPAMVILAAIYFTQHNKKWVLQANSAVLGVVALIMCTFLARPALTDSIGLSGATQQIRGWEEQARRIAAMSEGYDAIAVDDRSLMGAMLYYDRESITEIVALDPNAGVHHHYEAFKAFDPQRHKRSLFVTTRDDDAHVDYRFENITPLGADSMVIGSGERAYHLFDISGYYGMSLSR